MNRPNHHGLRIAQLIGQCRVGGAARVSCNLCLSLRRAGMDSYIITVLRGGSFSQKDPNSIKPISLGISKGRPASVFKGFFKLRRLLRHYRFDVVHVHGQSTIVFYALATIGMQHPPLFWFTWHNPDWSITDNLKTVRKGGKLNLWQAISLQLMTWSLHRADLIFGASLAIVDALAKDNRLKPKTLVFRNFTGDLPLSTAVGDEVPVLLWHGRIVATKRVAQLVSAAAVLKNEGLRFRLLIAGDSPYGNLEYLHEVKKQIRSLGLEDRVFLPGWVDDIPSLTGKSAIGIQCSVNEGLSLSLMECMSAGLAVVATDVGDTRAVVDHGRTGLLIPPDNVEALTDALRRLIADRDLRGRLGEKARRMMHRNYGYMLAKDQVLENLPEGSHTKI